MTLINTAWHHIRRSPFQSLTATAVIFMTFFFATVFTLITDGFDNVLNYFETKPEITLFLKDGLDKTTIEGIQNDLSAYPNIKEIKFISKEKALELYKEQNKDNQLLLEMVTANVLPASFEVSVSDPQTLNLIAENFTPKTTLIDEIIYQKDIIKSLLSWTNIIRKAGIAVIFSLSSIAFLLIFAIIGMKITNRKEEVNISRLLGASKFYVKKPFLLEGLFYGFFGSFFGFIVAFLISLYFYPQVNQFFQPVLFFSNNPVYFLQVFFVELLLGSLMGLIASWIGVRRYIKY